jgi:hypothetical protein
MRTETVAAITMVWNHPAYLAKWVDHYGGHFGRQNLYIVSHGPDTRHRATAEGCNYIEIPRAIGADLEAARFAMLSGFVRALLVPHRIVVMSDVDELLAIRPDAGKPLAEYLLAQMTPEGAPDVLAPVGLELLPERLEEGQTPPAIDWSRPLLQQMPRVLPRASYCKPCVIGAPVSFSSGGHGLRRAEPFRLDPNLMGFHIKYADHAEMVRHFAALTAELEEARQKNLETGSDWDAAVYEYRSLAATQARLARHSAFRTVPAQTRITDAARLFSRNIVAFPMGDAPPVVRVAPDPEALEPFRIPEQFRDLV